MRLLAALAACLITATASAEPVALTAKPIPYFSRVAPDRAAFGGLTFRGGLVLTSTSADFGGFSGLRVSEDGRLLAISDRAMWLEGTIVYEGSAPIAIENPVMFPILGAGGTKLAGTWSGDTEGLEVSGLSAWVSTERKHQVLRFDLGKGVAKATGVPIGMPKSTAGLPANAGLEGIALVPDGAEKDTLLIVAEEDFDEAGNHRAWLLPGRTNKPIRELSVKRRDEYALTDLTFLPGGGDLVILERRYRPPLSLNMRLRRIKQADIAEGAVLDGEVLIEASLADEIDNMEGLSVHRAVDGTSVLTLISDDNFNGLQRTVLLQFGMVE